MFVEFSEVFEHNLTYDAPDMRLCHVAGEMSLRCVAKVAFLFVDGGVCALNVTVKLFIKFKEAFTRFERTSMLVYHVCDFLNLSVECGL